MDNIGDVQGEDISQMSAPKRKKKQFATKIVDKKTQAPLWDYKGVHLMDIDDDIILKLQSDSIAVAVMGMQDGREKFAGKLKIANPNSEL